MDFENKISSNGIHYSRYIMSWIRKGGGSHMTISSLFAKWLREVEKLPEEEVREICNLASNGKLELEESVKSFIKENDPD